MQMPRFKANNKRKLFDFFLLMDTLDMPYNNLHKNLLQALKLILNPQEIFLTLDQTLRNWFMDN